MSNFTAPTFHPVSGEIEDAIWADDYFARHEYGVIFKDDVYKPWECERVFPKAWALIQRLTQAREELRNGTDT